MNTRSEVSAFSVVTWGRGPLRPTAAPRRPAGRRELVGRGEELRLLRAFVRDAATHGATRVVSADPGAGKSELLAAGVELASAAGTGVLRCAGSRDGAAGELSGLAQILWPLLGSARVPPGDRDLSALETLLVGGAPGPHERAALPYTVLRVLESVSAARPLLIAVDDWDALDAASAEVLAFVARRTAGHRLGLLLTTRPHTRRTPLTGLPALPLRPLTPAESAALLAARRPGHDPHTLRDLMASAAGNPLALLELPTWTEARVPWLPPSSSRLAAALAPGADRLPAATRDLLLVAALHPTADLTLLLAAAARLQGGAPDVAALEPAERQGLVVLDGVRLVFSHPAGAGAVVRGTGARRCRSAHAALAAELAEGSVRQLWHLSQAAEGTDAELAARAEDAHRLALRQDDPALALRLLRRAADLHGRPEDRGRCLLRAAQLAGDVGWGRTARALARRALAHPLGPLGSLYARTVTRAGTPAARLPAEPAGWPAPVGDAEIDSALELAGSTAPAVAADTRRADALLAYLDALPPRTAHDPRLLHAMATAAPVRRAGTVLARLPAAGRPDNVALRDLERLGEAALRSGDPLRALELHRQAERRCHFHDLPARLPVVLLRQGLAHLVTGDWGQAGTAFRRCGEHAGEQGLTGEATAAELLAGLTRALRTGTVPAPADAHAVEAARPSVSAIKEIIAVGTGWAQVESGDAAAGHATLARLLADPGRCTAVLFALVPFAEAAGAVHAAEPARARLRLLARELGPQRAPLVSVALAVAETVLADDEDAGAHFERALALGVDQHPFLEASLRLAHGRRLRRWHEFTDSRVTLRQAAATFTMMGADARVTRITEELRASGERADTVTAGTPRADGTGGAAGVLSSQELRIARLAARGLSNRQIGAELGLSPRTIGAYLYRIFPRLGVTARAQLAGVLGADGRPPA
ncbi:LuxR C-terminal-related transcriptional regulator [Streptomyces sp. NPDC049813]|uniref:helix-turn-helix transcriptional regulator n=1 Tax=Streptomyces sp. NPDC049813 TaxID=3365597 RepID=UPI0037BDBFE5